jgi:hypothetical protein
MQDFTRLHSFRMFLVQDGTLVPIRAPHDNEHIYVTRLRDFMRRIFKEYLTQSVTILLTRGQYARWKEHLVSGK